MSNPDSTESLAQQAQDDLRKERAHFASVLNAFDVYLPYCLSANNARRRSYYSLPRAHQEMLSDLGHELPLPSVPQSSKLAKQKGFRARLDEIDDRIRRNADLLSQIVQDSRGFLGDGEHDVDPATSESPSQDSQSSNSGPEADRASALRKKKKKVSGHEVDKIQSTLKQLVRDWSQEGHAERSLVYQPIVSAILSRFANLSPEQRGDIHVLVPGAGLGRLAFDLASQGFSCQGNEFSFYMLLTSHYILNKSASVGQHVIYPFVHSSSNWRTADDMLRPVHIPDVLPSELPLDADFSMVAGEFCEVYSKPEERQAWNVVATCFFIDTAKNVIRYLETLNHLLPIGGWWVNAGPLLWHFENIGDQKAGADNLSIELTLEELLHLCPKLGFEVEERWSLPPMTYTGILGGMLKYHYVPEFFVCRKVRDVAASPSV